MKINKKSIMLKASPKAIKYYRKEVRNITQEALAKKAGISRKTITLIEARVADHTINIQKEIFIKLKNALGINSTQIMGNDLPTEENSGINDIALRGKSLAEWIYDSKYKERDNLIALLEGNFRKVCEMYRVGISDILSLAPLLFMDFMEKSLEKEMKEFSEEYNDDYETRGAKYILKNFFKDFIYYSNKYDPLKNPNISLGEAMNTDTSPDWCKDSGDLNDLLKELEDNLRKKDLFMRFLNIGFDTEIDRESFCPTDKYIRKLLDKKTIRETFRFLDHMDQEGRGVFPYSNVIGYYAIKPSESYFSVSENEKGETLIPIVFDEDS